MSDATTVLGASTVAAPTVDPDTIRAFLIGMYGFEAKGWLTPTRKIVRAKRSYAAAESVPAVDIDTAVDWLARNAARADTWCGVCPRGTKPPGAKRGGKRTVLSIPSVWLDVDFIDPGHKNNEGLPADLDAALAIVHAMPLAPTVVISTGGGVQAHWCFHAPIQLDGAPPGFAQLPEAWVTFAQSLAGPGQEHAARDGEAVVAVLTLTLVAKLGRDGRTVEARTRYRRQLPAARSQQGLEELAAFGARLIGCTCSFELQKLQHSGRNLTDVQVCHDDDCPARDAGRQTLVTLDAHRAAP